MPISKDNIIQELRAQNPEALSALIDDFSPVVLALTRRILAGVGSPEDIEECVSDVFVAAWKQAGQYDERRGSVRTWLLILTKYQALELRRKLARHGNEPAEQMMTTAASRDDEGPVLHEVLARERQRELVACVREMEPGLREVFVRRYILHHAPADIATELGLSRSAVDNRLSRGRRWLRERMKDLEKGGGSVGIGTTS